MYCKAFYVAIRDHKVRPAPDARLSELAAAETRKELKTFFELVAIHDAASLTAGDYSLWFHVGDAAPGGAGVCIGATHGGDLFVVGTPGQSTDSTVRMLAHDEAFDEVEAWSDLEEFLDARLEEHRERMQEDYPDDESEWKTDLDDYLK